MGGMPGRKRRRGRPLWDVQVGRVVGSSELRRALEIQMWELSNYGSEVTDLQCAQGLLGELA